LTESEKELLTVLGKCPEMSLKDLVNHTSYKWVSTVIKKIEQFKDQHLVCGPFYEIDYCKLCKNPIHALYCIIEFSRSYETVIEYLKLIEPLKAVYPVLSPREELLNVIFLSSDTAETIDLLQLLKDNTIITNYTAHVLSHKRVVENPNFFGDFNPPLDNLLGPCDIPDLSSGRHDTNWNACDTAVLPYLEEGYKSGKLIEILRAEKKLNKTWKYAQINYSRDKMLKNGLIKKIYIIFPYKFDHCADFNLFLKIKDKALTQRILHNFAKGSRMYREYVLCGDWGFIGFTSHPQFLTGLMNKLDKIDEIKEKELYQLRSIPDNEYFSIRSLELKYFEVDEQTLKYPYQVYREKIKEKLDGSCL